MRLRDCITLVDNMKLYIKTISYTFLLLGFFLVPVVTSAGIITKPENNLGLVGYWTFNDDGSSTAIDYSGNGNTGTLTNMDTGSDYVTGYKTSSLALDFDGSNDYVNAGSGSTLDSTFGGVSEMTFVAWYKLDNVSAYRTFFAKGGVGACCDYSGLMTFGWDDYLNRFAFQIYDGSAGNSVIKRWPQSSLPLGEWAHLVVRYTDKNNIDVYINGQLASGGSYSANSYNSSLIEGNQDDNLWIGGPFINGQYYDGQMDDVRVYNRALSNAEIALLYSNRVGTFEQSNTNNLVGYWSFEDATGTTATDFSGNGNTGTLTNMDANTDWVNGRVGKTLDFDGSNDVVTAENSSTLSFNGATQISMSAWIKTPSPTDGPQIIQKDYSSGAGSWESYSFYLTGSGELQFSVTNGCCSNYIYRKGSLVVPANEWTHVATVWEYSSGAPSDVKFYMNGVLDPSVTSSGTSGTITQITAGSNGKLFIGDQARDGSGGGARLNGLLDEVRIYNTALTATQIQNLYQNSKKTTLNAPQNNKLTDGLVGYWTFNGKDLTTSIASDVSGNDNHGTLTNGPVPAQGKVGQGLEFDGVNDYMALSASVPPTNLTLNAWIKPNNLTSQKHIHSWYTTSINKDLTFQTNGSRLEMEFYTNGSNYRVTRSSASLVAGEWQMVTMVQTGSNHAQFYLNGALLSNDTEMTVGTPSKESLNRAIGRFGDQANEFWVGGLDEVRLYDRSLSLTEIERLYNLGR